MDPLISVIIPTYNRAHLIGRTVESVLSQEGPTFELTVVDDGSTDATFDALEPYRNRIRYLRKENGGVSSARNLGIAQCRGRYVALLDSDDIYLPGFLDAHVSALERHGPEYGLSFSLLRFSHDGSIPRTSSSRDVVPIQCSGQERLWPDALDLLLICRPPILPSNTVLRRDLLDGNRPFDESLICGEDTDLFFRLAMKTGFIEIEQVLGEFGPGQSGHTSLGALRRSNPTLSHSWTETIWARLLASLVEESRDGRAVKQVRRLLSGARSRKAAALMKEKRFAEARDTLRLMLRDDCSPKTLVKYMLGRFVPQTYQASFGEKHASEDRP